jgi:transposase-like protein
VVAEVSAAHAHERRMNPPPRHLRGDIPLTRKSKLSLAPDEDKELTRYLTRALKDARSMSLRPPACPHCHSLATILLGRPHARMPMPAFRCESCSKTFNRLTGTPLARLRHAEKLYGFVRLLSSQMSYKEAAEILQVDYTAIANWAKKLRAWLMQLDPTGAWESRVRLGIKPRPIGDCPQCGKNTAIRFFGFADDARTRRLSCGFCRMTFTVPKANVGRYEVKTEVAYDPVARARLERKACRR